MKGSPYIMATVAQGTSFAIGAVTHTPPERTKERRKNKEERRKDKQERRI